MRRTAIKFLIAFGLTIIAVVVAVLVFSLVSPTPPLPQLPKPNGYDDFARAGKLVVGETSEFPSMKKEEIAAAVLKNAEALRIVREGLSNDCRVPLDYAVHDSPHFQEIGLHKRLAQIMVAEGRLAEMDNRPGEAMDAYLNTVRFGSEITRGGVLIDGLIGIAVQSSGLTMAEHLYQNVDARKCREAAAALERADSRMEKADEILATEMAWAKRTSGWRYPFYRLIDAKAHRATIKSFLGKYHAARTRLRRLMVTMADRAYNLDNGKPPKSLSELVPTYLKAVPMDPNTGTNVLAWP
jgi:hypothetical protein